MTPTRIPPILAAAVALASCGGEPSGPELDGDAEPFGVVLGNAHAPGTSDFSGIVARVRWAGQDATNPVAADGSFAVPMLDSVSGFGVLTLEPEDGVDLNPAWVLLTRGDLDSQGRVVMVPRTWTITAGDHAGTTVTIEPDKATDVRVMPSYWGTFFPYSQDGFLQTIVDNATWSGQFQTWRSAWYPIPVALDRPGSNQAITEADSAGFWQHVDRLEAALGRDVFRPVQVEDLTILSGTRRAEGAVLVQFDTLLTLRGQSFPDAPTPWTWSLTADADTWSGGNVDRVGFVSANVRRGRVRFHDTGLLDDRALVVHELMHILGAGHGCSWPSSQTYCTSLQRDLPTAQDVAYLEVLEATRALEDGVQTRWGLLAAILGARAVTLGQPPIPVPALVYGPATVTGGTP